MEFSYHRTNHWGVLAATIGLLTVIETTGLHLIFVEHHPIIAWSLTILNLVALTWVAMDYLAVRARPIRVEPSRLILHRGLRAPIVIGRQEITDVAPGEAPFQVPADLGVFAVGRPNIIVSLRAPARIGRKKVARVAVFVDDPDAFVAALR